MLPTQTDEDPLITPADGAAITVKLVVATWPDNVYVIVTVPALMPETIPDVELIVATDGLLLDHEPPLVT